MFGALETGPFLESEDHALDSSFHERDMPIQEESKLTACQSQIRQELGLMDGEQGFNCLVFHHNAALDESVKSIAGIDSDSIEMDRQNHLLGDFEPTLRQCIGVTFLVGRFQQARAELTMDLDSGVHDFGRNTLQFCSFLHDNL